MIRNLTDNLLASARVAANHPIKLSYQKTLSVNQELGEGETVKYAVAIHEQIRYDEDV